MEKKILHWELLGVLFILTFGTTLHFWFEWTGYWRPVVIIAAVNESTWEHFKMAFWPTFFWGLLEYFLWGRTKKNFVISKSSGLLIMPVITAFLFYGYTVFWHHNLPADIAVFIASVAGGQMLSLYILRIDRILPHVLSIFSFIGIFIMVFLFSTLSYFPRENFLFAHPETGEYGILSDYSDHSHDDH